MTHTWEKELATPEGKKTKPLLPPVLASNSGRADKPCPKKPSINEEVTTFSQASNPSSITHQYHCLRTSLSP